MSIIVFELKEEHVKLLKQLSWSLLNNKFLVSTENYSEDPAPFGADNLYEGIDLILNGKPKEFDPFNSDEINVISDEQKSEFDKLMLELPTALDIILHNGNFELGTYKRKFHVRDWKKVVKNNDII